MKRLGTGERERERDERGLSLGRGSIGGFGSIRGRAQATDEVLCSREQSGIAEQEQLARGAVRGFSSGRRQRNGELGR